MIKDLVLVSIICPECENILMEVNSDIIDNDLVIFFPAITDKIDEISNNSSHNPNKRFLKCENCGSIFDIKQEISEDI